jgi:hypothetical protein
MCVCACEILKKESKNNEKKEEKKKSAGSAWGLWEFPGVV